MNKDIRQELLQLLAELSEREPKVRLGQLVVNLATLAKGPSTEAVWDVEDKELLSAAREQLKTLKARDSELV